MGYAMSIALPPPSQSSENIVSCENSDIEQYDGNISIFREK